MAGQVAPILLQPKEIGNTVNFVLNVGEFAQSFIPLLTHGLTYLSGMVWNSNKIYTVILCPWRYDLRKKSGDSNPANSWNPAMPLFHVI